MTARAEFVKFGHNEVAAACRDEILGDFEQLIYRFARGYNGERSPEAARRHFREWLKAMGDAP